MTSPQSADISQAGGRVRHVPVLKSLLAVEALAELLEAAYGLSDVRCQLIKATLRDTYRIDSKGGPFIFSIYRHRQRTAAEIEAELDFLAALANNEVLVAPAVPQANGERLLRIAAPEGERYAVLFTYIAGTPLSKSPEPQTVRLLGQTLARIHAVADGVRLESRPRIDDGLLIERSLAAVAPLIAHRPEDLAYLQSVCAELRRRIAALPLERPGYGPIHGDVIPSNVQVTRDSQVAMLDFDFCGIGWRAYDIATYVHEVAFWQTPETIVDAFLAGYQGMRPLADWELAAVPLFRAARGVFGLGIPAQHVDTWGSAYLTDGLVDRLLASIRQSMARIEAA